MTSKQSTQSIQLAYLLIQIAVALLIIYNLVRWGGVLPGDRLVTHIAITLLCLLTTIVWYFDRSAHTIKQPLAIYVLILGACFLLILGLSLHKTLAPHRGVLQLLTCVDAFLLFFITRQLAHAATAKKNLEATVATLASFASLYFIFSQFSPSTADNSNIFSIINLNHYAGFFELLIFFPIVFLLGRSLSSRNRQLFYAVLAITMLALLAFTLSRGALLSFTLTLLIIFIIIRKHATPKQKRFLTVSIGIAISLSLVLFIFADNFGGKSTATSHYYRATLLTTAWKIFQQQPLAGTGLGSFPESYLQNAEVPTHQYHPMYTHNDYLQLMTESGVFALLIAAMMIALFIKAIPKRPTSLKESFLVYGACGGILCLLMHALVDFSLHIPVNLLLATYLAGYFFTFVAPKETRPQPKHPVCLAFVVVMAAAILPSSFLVYKNATSPTRLNSINADYYINVSRDLTELNRPTDALNYAAIGFHLKPTSQSAVELARVFEMLENSEKAGFYFEKSVLLDPMNPTTKEIAADFFMRQYGIRKALDYYEAALQVNPKRFNGLLALLEGRLRDPILLERIVPDDAASQKLWIDFLSRNDYFDLALQATQAAKEKFSQCQQGFHQRVIGLSLKANKLDATKIAIDELRKHCPQEQDTLHLMQARLYRAEKDYEQALLIYSKLLHSKPEKAFLDEVTTLVAKHTELVEPWHDTLTTLYKKHPDQPHVKGAAITMLRQQGEWRQAVQLAKQLSADYMDDIGYKKLLASLYLEKQVYAQFFRIYRDILTRAPEDVASHIKLAEVYYKLRLYDEAIKVLQNANKIHPENEIAKRLLKEVTDARKKSNRS